MIAEKFVVLVDELSLSDGREKLALIDGLKLIGVDFAFELRAATGYCTRGDEDDLDPLLVKFCHLIDQCRHTGHIERTILASQYVRSYLDGYAE